MSHRQIVIEIIENNFCANHKFNLADDASFFEEGLIDSLGLLELVAALERRFGITFKDEELTPDNLDSVQAIVNYLESRKVSS